ncbi:hypothetical protein PAHAL_5G376700 [Panicum hallii]|uniref:Uncharacterized protein n=1 Tax=Panicum hallii TaxID=206008 RepID=A0A2S3HVD7_9POAL|nr:hypothetical protein PAHAL_5G376700 [Panicum hallii]
MWQIILHHVSNISSYKILSDAQTRRSINMPRRKRHQVSDYGSIYQVSKIITSSLSQREVHLQYQNLKVCLCIMSAKHICKRNALSIHSRRPYINSARPKSIKLSS